MSQVDLIQNEEVQEAKIRRYCRQCWRYDFHFDMIRSQILFGFLVVITFGLILVVRPSRCVCCGTWRIF